MPELPEVESVVRALNESFLIGKKLVSVKRICPKIPSQLQTLVGHRILKIERRGKYIDFNFGKIHLVVHLRMTGQFLIKDAQEEPERHERVIFYFSDALHLAFHDTRRFGTFDITDQPEAIFGKLGPEPLDLSFSSVMFFDALSKKSKVIKASLLDQTVIAGIGNIYADEALWDAKIHPERISSSLSKKESGLLLEAVRKVLKIGIENGGTSLGDGAPNFHHLNGQSGSNQNTLQVYGKEGEPCLRCSHLIEKIVVQQRGTHFCPRCQDR